MINSEFKPMSVYYLHFKDDRGAINNWNRCVDYVCCVMARTQEEAIEITESISLSQPNAMYIKVVGIGFCEEEWTKMPQPMRTDEEFYKQQVKRIFDKVYSQ